MALGNGFEKPVIHSQKEMNRIKFLVLSALLVSLLLVPYSTSAQSENTASPSGTIDIYAVFWPLVPGRTMGDSMYPLKLFKETIGDWFSFGDVKKAEYYTTLSEKRALEIYKLFIDNKDYNNGAKTLEANQQYLKKAFDLIKKAEKDQQKVDTVKGKFATSLENQEKIFKLLQFQLPDDQKNQFNKALENTNSYLTLLP